MTKWERRNEGWDRGRKEEWERVWERRKRLRKGGKEGVRKEGAREGYWRKFKSYPPFVYLVIVGAVAEGDIVVDEDKCVRAKARSVFVNTIHFTSVLSISLH